MYDNISKLQFQQGPNGETLATAMISAEGEYMQNNIDLRHGCQIYIFWKGSTLAAEKHHFATTLTNIFWKRST
jgi:hypothetical protein